MTSKEFNSQELFDNLKSLIEYMKKDNVVSNSRPTLSLGINMFNTIREKWPEELKRGDVIILVGNYIYNPETDELEELENDKR